MLMLLEVNGDMKNVVSPGLNWNLGGIPFAVLYHCNDMRQIMLNKVSSIRWAL